MLSLKGWLRAELTTCLPLGYVCWRAGRRRGLGALWRAARLHPRFLALSAAHAHLVGPAVTAAAVTAFRDGVDYRIVKGVMLWSRGGGCGWLSLALSASPLAPSGVALIYALSLLAAPLSYALVCGAFFLPSPLGVASTLATTAAPFLAGAWRAPGGAGAGGAGPGAGERLCALALLYAECCERLCDAEGMPYISDVLVTLALELAAVLGTCAAAALYVRGGALSAREARALALCAVPRALHTGYEPVACVSAGLCRLPAVFAAPAQALLLAALAPDDAPPPPPPPAVEAPSPPDSDTLV